jgi:GT2 family glycosyltransferase
MVMPQSRLNLTVAIATSGRRETLSDTLRMLSEQTRLPDRVVISPAQPEDCDESVLPTLPYPTSVVRGPKGLTHQRNTILESTLDADVIVFFDDDFYPRRDFFARAERLFLAYPDVVGLTGRVLADGKLTEGISHQEALSILSADGPEGPPELREAEVYNLYGCNMLVRAKPIHEHQLRFDTNLPLYGWLEDVDFTRRLARYGRLLEDHRLSGVHLATKRGRTSGVRFGYSQVANPLYLMTKGTMSPSRALSQIARNVARNVQRTVVAPEPWIDRRGRLRGNLIAFSHLVAGRLRPQNVTSLG